MERIFKLMSLNIGNPSEKRVQNQIQWIESRSEDVFVLTETKNSEGCNYLENYFLDYGSNLFHMGSSSVFDVSFPKSLTGDLGVMCVSKHPIKKTSHYFEKDSPYYARLDENDIVFDSTRIHLMGVYVPSRDASVEKIERKKVFLEKLLDRVSSLDNVPSIICGDFNILDRNHIPKYSTFMNWEYDFYDKLIANGYVDAYRFCNPNKQEYSWVGRTNDGYRYDYCFVSNALVKHIKDCYFVHETRELKLTDHSGIVLELDMSDLR